MSSPLHPSFNGSASDVNPTPWWRDAVIYQVYPRSFADSDGDGTGDLRGICSRIDHFVALGVDAVWLSPFYRSPQRDGGYDVADYRDVDPLFGTLADFKDLLAVAHRAGLRVIVDFVPNHTSNQHVWFQAALTARPGSPERARYLFRDGAGPRGDLPPNNWQSVFGGPAWTRVVGSDGTPEQWYLHLFDATQPDLDWENPEVGDECESVLRFWLDRGVDGFRIDVAHGLVKAPGLPDWEGRVAMIDGTDVSAPEDGATSAGNTGPMFDQDGVHEIYRRWRRVVDEYDGDRVLVAEAWVEPLSRLARYVRHDEMHQAFNFSFLTTPWDATRIRTVIAASLRANDEVGATTTWVLSNHDVMRHASRMGLPDLAHRPNGLFATDPQPDAELGLRRAHAATLLMLALPGSAYIYQGEELGLPEHTTLPDDVRQDPTFFRTHGREAGRDGCRVPLPWKAAAPGYGFSPTGATWLPPPESYAEHAADIETSTPGSTFDLYRQALAVRQRRRLGAGSLAWCDAWVDNPDVVALRNGEVVALSNLGSQSVTLPRGVTVLVSSSTLPSSGETDVPTDTTVWYLPPGR